MRALRRAVLMSSSRSMDLKDVFPSITVISFQLRKVTDFSVRLTVIDREIWNNSRAPRCSRIFANFTLSRSLIV